MYTLSKNAEAHSVKLQETTPSFFLLFLRHQRHHYRFIKDVLESLLCQRTALDEHDGLQLLGKALALLLAHRLLLVLGQLLQGLGVVPQVHLGAHQEEGRLGAVALDLRHPLLLGVLVGGWRDHAEADQEDVGLGVRQGPQSVVVLLAWGGELAVAVNISELKGLKLLSDMGQTRFTTDVLSQVE